MAVSCLIVMIVTQNATNKSAQLN